MYNRLLVALFCAAVVATFATAALADGLPDAQQVETDRVMDLTMRSARTQMLTTQPSALALMSKKERAAHLAREQAAQDRRTVRSALASGADASYGAAPALSRRQALRALKAIGERNARAARKLEGQAKRGEPPRYDDKGWYFSLAQTDRYYSSRWSERAGRFSPEFYDLLQCRRAVPMGFVRENFAWRWEWATRVCPDEQGLYRPTL